MTHFIILVCISVKASSCLPWNEAERPAFMASSSIASLMHCCCSSGSFWSPELNCAANISSTSMQSTKTPARASASSELMFVGLASWLIFRLSSSSLYFCSVSTPTSSTMPSAMQFAWSSVGFEPPVRLVLSSSTVFVKFWLLPLAPTLLNNWTLCPFGA